MAHLVAVDGGIGQESGALGTFRAGDTGVVQSALCDGAGGVFQLDHASLDHSGDDAVIRVACGDVGDRDRCRRSGQIPQLAQHLGAFALGDGTVQVECVVLVDVTLGGSTQQLGIMETNLMYVPAR